jgi:mannose-6-phosphate isomerase-like protein (cupin superfamily)
MPDEEPPVDLIALAERAVQSGVAWKRQTADLNLNLVVLDADGGIGVHVNTEVDVLLVGVEGAGRVEVEGRVYAVHAGQAVVISMGLRRSIRPVGERFAYLTCHRRRAGLRPD